MPDQIDLYSPFGSNICNLAKDSKYKTFLDVGTWNGEGTTMCLYEGIANRKHVNDVMIYSVEANKEMLLKAVQFWKPVSPPFLQLIHGTLHKRIMDRQHVMNDHLFPSIKNHFDLYYEEECRVIIDAPELKLSGDIDFVVLNGGEFSSRYDFEVIMGLHPKVIALNDINVIKNNYAYNNLLLDRSKWELHSKGSDRNGWAIFTARH